jgi:hypothetical protein
VGSSSTTRTRRPAGNDSFRGEEKPFSIKGAEKLILKCTGEIEVVGRRVAGNSQKDKKQTTGIKVLDFKNNGFLWILREALKRERERERETERKSERPPTNIGAG